MPAAIAAIASLGAGYLSSQSQKKATQHADQLNERQRAAAFAYLQQVRSQDALFGGLQRSALLSGQQKELGGFTGAGRAIDLGGIAARQTVGAQGKINQANVEQSAVSRGLLGTSTGVQALQGVGDRTTAQLAAIDQQQAQAHAELGLQKSALQGQQGRELFALEGQNRDVNRELGYELASLAPRLPGKGKKKKHGLIKGVYDIGDLGSDLSGG